MRLIDADALKEKIRKEVYRHDYIEHVYQIIDNAPTVPVVDITKRDLCADISCTDCPFMKETCKLMDYVAYADRPHGEWIKHKWAEEFDGLLISNYECTNCHSWERNNTDFCPNCGADMREENK